MRARASAVPATLIVLVLFPFVVAVGSGGSAEKQKDEPKEASLTAHLVLPPGFDQKRPLHVKVKAPGQAPSGQVVLVDSAGLNVATAARARNDKDCNDTRLRLIASTSTASSTDWCLEIRGLEAGTEATGTLPGGATKLALTVGVRHNWWGFPMAVALLGLIAAFAVLVVPDRLRAFVKEVLLARALDHNDRATIGKRIDGLRAWVSQQLHAGKTASELLPIVVGVINRGPEQAAEARRQLAQALNDSKLPPDHPLRATAQPEATRKDHRESDFLTDEGGLKDEHPASRLAAVVERMNEHARALAEEQQRIDRLNPQCRTEPLRAIGKARLAFDRVEGDAQLPALEQALTDLTNSVDTAFSTPGCAPPEPPEPRGARPKGDLAPSIPLVIAPGDLGRALAMAGVLTFLVVAVVIAFAFLSIFFANYVPTENFGTQADYFTLFTAALGSSAAATVLATLLYWKADDKAEE